MPNDIAYKSSFVVKHSIKKNFARIFVTIIIIVAFSILWIIAKHETRYLFAIFVVLGFALLILSLISFSFHCYVTESLLESSFWGLLKKQLQWSNVKCLRVIEKIDEKSVIIAIYDESGKCIIDLNTDMENAWYLVKMAEEKSINIYYEKDLSLKQISHFEKSVEKNKENQVFDQFHFECRSKKIKGPVERGPLFLSNPKD